MNFVFKVILGVVSVGICSFVGLKMSEKYKLRREFFNDFVKFNQLMVESVTFSKESILKTIKSFNGQEYFLKLLNDYLVALNNGKFVVDFWFIDDAEKENIIKYFNSLGKNDTSSELSLLKNQEIKIKNCLEKAEKEEKSYKGLYLKLGFLCGLAVFILIL